MDETDVRAQIKIAIDLHSKGDFAGAAAIYLQILQVRPRYADPHHLLGLVYLRQGRTDAAIKSIDQAIAIDPGQAIFYNSLGGCYIDRQEWAAAELCFEKALGFKADYPDAWNNLGLVRIYLQRLDGARSALEKGLTFAPHHELLLCNLAEVLLREERYTESLAEFERVLSRHPHSESAITGRATCLEWLGRSDEALSFIEQNENMVAKRLPELMQLKARILEDEGRIREAWDALEKGLTVAPENISLLYAAAQNRKVDPTGALFQRLENFESRLDGLSNYEKSQISYALGKAYLDFDQIEKAAELYAKGAAAILQFESTDPSNFERAIREIEKQVTSEFLSARREQGVDSASPIFIVGMPRSGSTLVEQILAGHPQIHAAGELHFLDQVLNGISLGDNAIYHSSSPEAITEDLPLRRRAEMYVEKLNALAAPSGKSRVTDKMLTNFLHVGLISVIFPNARIVHCRRDPLDCCISAYTHHFTKGQFWTYDLTILGRTFRAYWDLMSQYRKMVPGKFLDVRYEQVVDDLEGSARKLLDWCGLPWDDRCLRFHQTERSVRTASVRQVRQPIYTSSKGRWKKWEPYIQPLLNEIGDLERAYWAEIE